MDLTENQIDLIADRVAHKLGRETDPFVTADEAARLLRIKHARNLPRRLRRYQRDANSRPLFKRDEVIALVR